MLFARYSNMVGELGGATALEGIARHKTMPDLLAGISLLTLAALFCYLVVKAPGGHSAYRGWVAVICCFLFLRALSCFGDALQGVPSPSRLIDYSSAIAGIIAAAMSVPMTPRRMALYRQAEETRAEIQERVAEVTHALRESEQQHRNLLGQLIAAQQQERKHLSYEVHDGFTQKAHAVHQYLMALQHRFQLLPMITDIDVRNRLHYEIQEEVDEATALAKETVDDARTIIDDLHTSVLDDFGLAAAIERKVAQLAGKGWCITFHRSEFDEAGYKYRAHPESEAALYRIVQESLSNIQKHANASCVDIYLTLDGEDTEDAHAVLTITDDGVGFDADLIDQTQTGGVGERIGLNAMRQRMRNLGGVLTVESAPGVGTSIRAEIPLIGTPREGREYESNEAHPDR